MKAADVSASIDTAALRALLDEGTPGRWIAGAAREDGTAQVYCPNRGPLRVIVPVAETEPHNAALIAALRNAAPALLDAADERDRLRDALDKINAIRNSIVGLQKVNWSEHIYPLVAALDAAGFVGQTYAEARSDVGTLMARAVSAEAESAALRDERDRLRSELSADEIRECNAESEPPTPRRLAHLMCGLEGMDREEFVDECFNIARALPKQKQWAVDVDLADSIVYWQKACAAMQEERDRLRSLVEARDVCVVCGNVLLPAPEPHCEGCDTAGPRYTDPE